MNSNGGVNIKPIQMKLLLIFVAATLTSEQVTFSRQWVRGSYPGDSAGDENADFQMAAKSVLSKMGYFESDTPIDLSTLPLPVSQQILEDIFRQLRDQTFGTRKRGIPTFRNFE